MAWLALEGPWCKVDSLDVSQRVLTRQRCVRKLLWKAENGAVLSQQLAINND